MRSGSLTIVSNLIDWSLVKFYSVKSGCNIDVLFEQPENSICIHLQSKL